jgi:hypothetical protein
VYLFAALTLTACFAAGWLLRPGLRRSSLLAAGVLAPFAVLGAVFVPAYWRPDHLFTFLRGVGIEDVLFCFACGGLGWIVAAAGSGAVVSGRVDLGCFVSRFLGWSALATCGVLLATATGCSILPAVVVGFTAGGLVVWTRTPRTSRLVVPGAVGFAALYAVVSWIVLSVFPACAGFWTGEAISGRRVLGLPVEELVWALSFGATWPVVFAWCLGDGVVWPSRPPQRPSRGLASGGRKPPVGVLPNP